MPAAAPRPAAGAMTGAGRRPTGAGRRHDRPPGRPRAGGRPRAQPLPESGSGGVAEVSGVRHGESEGRCRRGRQQRLRRRDPRTGGSDPADVTSASVFPRGPAAIA